MDDKPVNRWQEVLYDLCFRTDLVCAKSIAHRLHRAHDYLSDICRRERVDPFAVFNEILKHAEPLSQTDLPRFTAVCGPIFGLLTGGTNWMAYYKTAMPPGATFGKLCEQTGVLLQDLGAVIEHLAAIESDGAYNADDTVSLGELQVKADQVIQRLHALGSELDRRVNAKEATA